MYGFEKKIYQAIGKKIRSSNPAIPGDVSSNPSDSNFALSKVVSVREAQFSDFDRVCALNLRLGQGPDSLENWDRLWVQNPAIQEGSSAARIGWVLEATGGEIVGFLGSVPLTYELNGRTLRTAATCRFAVETAYRAFSHLLVVSFFRQKDIDFFLNTTATPAAAQIVKALRALPVPQADYGRVLFWILNRREFSAAVLRKMGVWSPVVASVSLLCGLGLRANDLVRQSRWQDLPTGFSITESVVDDLGTEFESLLSEKRKEKPLLWAKRTPETMKWHFNPPRNRRVTKVLNCRADNTLVGYMIVRVDPEGVKGLRRALVADLQVKKDDPTVLGYLLRAALSSAKEAGCDVFEIIGFPESIRRGLAQWRPYSRDYPECPFYYKAQGAELQKALAKEGVWYASPFDGDGTLWP